MTPRSLFTIILKIMGIYMVLSSLSVIPQLLSTLYMFYNPGEQENTLMVVMTILVLVLVTAAFFVILRLFLYKTDWLIDKLSIDKHFTEERFELNIHRSTVLTIAIIVIGGLMIVDALPSLCNHIYAYIRQRHDDLPFGENQNAQWLIFEGVKILVGYLLLTNSRLAVNFIERQRKK